MKTTEKTLKQLFWPVFIEYTLLMLAGVADTVMLSMVSDQAVAAVGTSNTYLYLVSMIFTCHVNRCPDGHDTVYEALSGTNPAVHPSGDPAVTYLEKRKEPGGVMGAVPGY